MAIHSSTIAWKIPWTEEPGGYSPRDRKELDTTDATKQQQQQQPSITQQIFIEHLLYIGTVLVLGL